LCVRKKSLAEVLGYYPEMRSKNDSGKEVTEYSNKYWLMLSQEETQDLYPQKEAQKYASPRPP
jgi:hypothetical protein